ncbi:MAG TPA: tryptophan-rich sensory protein [Dermatophilaceae bacterium]|nr:tryptophan-rich sensory protein [Dermatophilaceae bacterium]
MTAPSDPPTAPRRALVTGASGYLGGLLTPRLLEQGWAVRVLTRRRSGIAGAVWAPRVEVVEGDAGSDRDLDRALDGVTVAYYLVHSMEGGDFVTRDRELAQAFAAAAERAGVQRIVYLGGLHPQGEPLSPHMASREEVGRILLESRVPTAVLQAAVVLGDGSASFDMLRYLAGRLPAMIAPRWLDNRLQPVAADDAVRALAGAATLPAEVDRAFDIGGPDVLTYRELLQRYAAVTGLRRRLVVTVPVLTPRLASHWVGLVTPVPAPLAKPLVESLVHDAVCRDRDLEDHLDAPLSTGVDEAIRQAMRTAPADTGPRNLAVCLGAVGAAAVLGGLATQPDSRWYAALDKPSWQPPQWAFPVAWSGLYAGLALASAATLTELDRDGEHERAAAYRVAFACNLAVNAGWSAVFFRGRRLGLATAVASGLAASSADLARRAGTTRRRRGAALGAYAAWCGFATALSGELARRNR